jgi:hypothetical protein
VADAIGVSVTALPLSPDRVFGLLDQGSMSSTGTLP